MDENIRKKLDELSKGVDTIIANPDDIEKLIPALGMNVLLNIVTPVLVAIGLFIG